MADEVKPKQEVFGPVAPSLDSDKFDSLGNKKGDDMPPGSGKGPTAPLDSFSVDEIAAKNKAAEKKLATSNLSDSVDSRGMKKGSFEVTPQGYDKHGMRLPDKVDYSKPLDAPVAHGPRGKNAPKDSFQHVQADPVIAPVVVPKLVQAMQKAAALVNSPAKDAPKDSQH